MFRKILLPLAFLQLTTALYSEDAIWIDFGELPPGYMPEAGAYVRQYDPAPIQDDDETVVDYSNFYDPLSRESQKLLPQSFENQTSQNGNSAYDEMRLSLALDRWQVKLSSSSNFADTQASTQVVAYKVKDSSSRFAGEQIMAVHFDLPNLKVNSKARLVPEFPIPAYSIAPNADLQAENTKPTEERMGQFLGKGTLRNVGPIRSITAVVYGRLFPISLTIEAEHTDVGYREYPMGSLRFSGWQDLVWTNPNYVTDVRKRNYNQSPEYPRGMPSIILRALRLDRPMHAVSDEASQIVFYVKQISIVYDKAVQTLDTEIDDEQIWQLNTINAQKHNYSQFQNFRSDVIDRYVELQKRHSINTTEAQAEETQAEEAQAQ